MTESAGCAEAGLCLGLGRGHRLSVSGLGTLIQEKARRRNVERVPGTNFAVNYSGLTPKNGVEKIT